MPKVHIDDKYSGDDNAAVADGSQARIRLGWSKEASHVELATIAPDGMKLEPTPEGNGWFVQLDRAGCNRLIHSVRRARDAAFGKDA